MRIVPTALLTAAFLGVAIAPGWCPEPVKLTAPMTGNAAAAIPYDKPKPPPKPVDPKAAQTKPMSQQARDTMQYQQYQRARSGASSGGNAAMDRLQGM